MTHINNLKKFRPESGNYEFFQFNHHDYTYTLLGYPHLRGFISATDSDFAIEVQPEINFNSFRIELPKELLKKKTKDEKAELEELDQLTGKKFFSTFPEELAKLIQLFPDSHLELARAVIDYGKDFTTFVNSNRPLAYILVNLEKFNKSYKLYNSLKVLQLTLSNKQKEILRRALFPGTDSMVKIISRIPPEILSLDSLIGFRNALLASGKQKEKLLKILVHQKDYNENLMFLLSDAPSVVEILNINAFNQLVKSPNYENLLERFKKVISESKRWKVPVPELSNINEIDKTEKKLTAAIQLKKDQYNNFPEPPIRDTDKIFAIRTVADQKTWSKRQHNCIKDYIKNVHARKSYFYKIINGFEEATLEIKLHDQEPRKGDLLGPMNHKVSAKIELLVEKWLSNYRKLKKKKALKLKAA